MFGNHTYKLNSRTLIPLLCMVMFCIMQANAHVVELWVQNADHVVVQDAKGAKFSVDTGDNVLLMEDNQSPLRISGTDKGAPQEIFYDGNTIMNISGAVEIPVSSDLVVKVWTKAKATDATVTFNCEPGQVDITSSTGAAIDVTGFNKLPIGSRIDIKAAPKYKILNITTSCNSEVTEENGVYSVTVEKNMTININTASASVAEGNIMVNIDNSSYVTLKCNDGTELSLENGDNRFTLTPKKAPLSLTANPGAEISMCVVNGDFVFADEAGVYTLRFNTSDNVEIYIMTAKTQSNSFTVNILHPDDIVLKDASGTAYSLTAGENVITFDFDNLDNEFNVSAIGDAVLSTVVVDNQPQTITDNTARFLVYRNSIVDIATTTNEDTGWITIVDEDFNAFNAGDNDHPDTTPLLTLRGDFENPGLFKPYHDTCSRGWGGDKIYAAGGALAMMNGFLNCPVGDYSGNLKMTFRARLIPGYDDSSDQIEALLIRDSQLVDFKRQTYRLTDSWQDFEFEADNGWFYDTRIQFFCATDAYFEIDDVKIQHRITGIEPPIAEEPTDVTNNSFVANWNPTDTAEDYLLSVYEHGESPETYKVSESFEGLQGADTDPIVTMPQGWESFNCAITEDNALVADGSKAVLFPRNGSYIVTPTSPYGLTSLEYSMSAVAKANASAVIAVSALTDTGWMPWLVHPASYFGTNPGPAVVDATQHLKQYGNIYAVKFEVSAPATEDVRIAIDNVKYSAPAPPVKVYLWEDKLVEGKETTSFVVEDDKFNPEADYWYCVKARNSSYTSQISNEVEVFNAHTPVALEATEVTDSSFKAAWECGNKADRFELTLHRTFTAGEDTTEALVLHENFSKVKSTATPEQPEVPLESYMKAVPIDDYTHLPGWTASSVIITDGALGGFAATADDIQGALNTPVMDLSNNNGKCNVKVLAWLEKGEPLQIQGNSVVTYNVVQWPETGWGEVTFPLEYCSDREKITLWTGTGKRFLVKDFKIYQSLKAGEEVDIITNSLRIDDASARTATVSGIEQYGNYSYSYDVASHRLFHGDEGNIFISPSSNRVKVMLDNSGVDNITVADSTYTVQSVPGSIIVRCASNMTIDIYNTDGRHVCSRNLKAGYNKFNLNTGVYILHTSGSSRKVMVP